MSSWVSTSASAGESQVANGTATVEATAIAVASGQRADDEDNASDNGNSDPPVLTAHMPSDCDAESASSLSSPSGSGCPSPVPAARAAGRASTEAAGKGILVHNSKRSSNTNRVSFVTGPSSSGCPSQSPSPPAKRSHHCAGGGGGTTGRRPSSAAAAAAAAASDAAAAAAAAAAASADRQQQQLVLPYHARTGRRQTGFGVKSHLHEFYDDPDGRESFQDYDGDDFKYCVEPPELRWRRHCSGAFAVLGLAVMAVGAAAMVAGHWIPARDPVVDREAGTEAYDREAVEFNDNLASCRYAGSMVFAVGVVFTVVRFWASVIWAHDGKLRDAADDCGDCDDDDDNDDDKTGLQRRRRSSAAVTMPHRQQRHGAASVRIPITGSVETVQPDPKAIDLRFGRNS